MSASPESCVSAGDPKFPEGALSYNVRILSAQALLDSHRNSQLKLKVILVLVGSVHSPSPCYDIISRPHTSFLCTFHFASGWAVAGLTRQSWARSPTVDTRQRQEVDPGGVGFELRLLAL